MATIPQPTSPATGTGPGGGDHPPPVVAPGLVLATVVVVWGLGPPVSKLITAPGPTAAAYRFWMSVPLLLVLSAAIGRWPDRDLLRRTAVPGVAFGINMVFVFLSVQASAVAVLSIVTTLQPGFLLLVAGPFLGERPGRWHVVWTLIGIAGSAVVILGAGDGVSTGVAGVAYAVAAMASFTLYFVATKTARSGAGTDIHPIPWMAGISLFAALAVTPWALVAGTDPAQGRIDGLDWLWLAVLVVVTGSLGHVLMAWTHRYVDATRSSLFLLLMNVVAIGSAWPLHDEPVTLVQVAGGIVVFGAVAAVVSRPAPGPAAGPGPAVR